MAARGDRVERDSDATDTATPTAPVDAQASGGPRTTVAIEGVTKRFGDVVAVREVDVDVGDGEFFTLLGPSGCGKTTTLRIVAGFEEPSAGRVLIDGRDVSGLPAHRRPTNTVFQSYALFPHLSVSDNVAFGLKRKGVDRADITRRVGEELERVGLTAESGRKPAQLSGGQQQRVALARALVNLPKVLLLDEPLGALDLKLRKGLQLELKRIQREVGITFVYVTHDQEEALTMSDRIAVMNRGQVEQIDSPEEVYERPSTSFVAGFIGVSNLMPAIVTSSRNGGVTVRLDTGVVAEAEARGFADGERCHAVVRPEKLHIEPVDGAAGVGPAGAATSSPPDGWPRIEGTVESSVYLGTSTQVVVGLGERVRMTVLVPNADEAARGRLPGGGARVRLSWAPEHMHLVRDSGDDGAATGSPGASPQRQDT